MSYCRSLLYLYLIYLAAIPLALHWLFISRGHGTLSIAIGWIPAMIYAGTMFQFVAVDSRPVKATIRILIVPLQIILHTIIFSGGFEALILEEAFVELGGCLSAMTWVMFIHRPSGLLGVFLGGAMALGLMIPIGSMLIEFYSHATPVWISTLMVAVALLTSIINWSLILSPMASGRESAYSKQGRNKIRQKFLNQGVSDKSTSIPIGIEDPQRWLSTFFLIYVAIWVFGGVLVNLY